MKTLSDLGYIRADLTDDELQQLWDSFILKFKKLNELKMSHPDYALIPKHISYNMIVSDQGPVLIDLDAGFDDIINTSSRYRHGCPI